MQDGLVAEPLCAAVAYIQCGPLDDDPTEPGEMSQAEHGEMNNSVTGKAPAGIHVEQAALWMALHWHCCKLRMAEKQ